jgi:L-2-hydroxyglutarate oxidase
MRSTDFLVVGGGILGLTTAHSLIQRGARSILILEKEAALGLHASGRNSGVLHAGLYYSADSLKGRFCIAGAQAMKAYAAEKSIPCLPLGKVLVASNAQETDRLDALYQRATANKVPVEKLTPAQLSDREPEARTYRWALLSPSTAVIDPKQVLEELRKDLIASGKCAFLFQQPLLGVTPKTRQAQTPSETIQYGHLINVAGLFADRVARMLDVGRDYQLIPFRGSYLHVAPEYARRIRGLIYPVPDPALPFLGVHYTRSAGGDVYVGPTAAPAFGREHYEGTEGIKALDSRQIVRFLISMILRGKNGMRKHVGEELRKQLPGGIWRAAQKLTPSLRREDLQPSHKVGIRAQLIHLKKMELVQDFVIENGAYSTHVLNAVSPGFTASFAFGAHIAEQAMN